MTENLDEILNHSNGYKDFKSSVFQGKDQLDPNGCDGTKDSLVYETKERNEFWNVQELDDTVFFEDISRSNKHEIRVSPLKDDLSEGLSNLISCKRNGNPFACDTEDRDHPWSIPEFEGSMIVDFLDDKEKGVAVSNAQFTSVSEFLGTDTHLYTDKGVVECKFPESKVCYKANNCNIMKDICMDEGVPLMDKIVTESREEDQPDSSVSLAADKHQPRNTWEGIDSELASADESKASSVENTFKISVDHHTTKEDEDTKSLVPNGLNPFLEYNMSKDADKDSYVVMKIFGSKGNTIAKATTISEKELGIQNSKESTSDADQSRQQLDQFLKLQMPSPVAALNSQNAVSTDDETNNNEPACNFFNSIKSETGAITYDFNLTELASSSSIANDVKNLSLKLEAASDQKDGSSDSFSAATQVYFPNSVDSTDNSVYRQSFDPQNVANLENKNAGNPPLGVHGHFADGEASFPAAGPTSGLITYSGPLSHSANISLRSDSSTTSARSFAFPVLQSEGYSSPERMAHAERRHLQKHRGWRQSLLCCKF